jgi:8-oxo-dGTP diphosphatase
MSEFIHVAVGVIVGADQKVLIARRPPDAHQGDLWEFPGGKLEAGESVIAALRRELQEELDIDIDTHRCFPLKKISHHYGDRSVLLDVWRVDSFRGKPRGRELQEIMWQSADMLDPRDFPLANHDIIKALKLPRVLAITGICCNWTECREKIVNLLATGITLVQFRQPQLTESEFLGWADAAAQLCRKNGARLLVNCSTDVYRQIDAHGLHINAATLGRLDSRPVSRSGLFSAACHTLSELTKAEQLGADFALLSPVAPTSSHPEARPLGWQQFRTLASQVSIPVYALGGMTPEDLPDALAEGAHGIAAISALW